MLGVTIYENYSQHGLSPQNTNVWNRETKLKRQRKYKDGNDHNTDIRLIFADMSRTRNTNACE